MTGAQQAKMVSGYLHGAGTTINLGNFAFLGDAPWGAGMIGGDSSGVVVNQGNFVWGGGSLVHNGLINQGNLTISGSSGQPMIGDYYPSGIAGVLTNAGTVTHTSAAGLYLTNGSTLNNLVGAVYDVQGDVAIATFPTGASQTTINNAGLFRKSAGNGTATIDSYIAFNNTGTVEVDSGTLSIRRFTQTAGISKLAGGSLAFATAQLAGGVLTGNGVITGDISNTGGEVSPGSSAGLITINGNYTQGASGGLLIELGGLANGQFDLLDVNGAASLGGRIEIAFLDGFRPQVGDTFAVLDYNSRTGAFGEIDSLTCPGYVFTADYGPNGLTLVTAEVPEPASLSLLLIGAAVLLRKRRKP